MTRISAIFFASVGLLSLIGAAHAQVDRGELPDGIRKLIRAADEAEQRVRRENGVAVDQDAERQARTARIAARRAIREYWLAKFDYDRAAADLATANSNAAEAQQHFLQVKAASIPDPPRLQKAETDRDDRLNQVADAAIKLEQARQALESAGRSAPSASTTAARPTPPPEPAPAYGSVLRGGPVESLAPTWRLVYRNVMSSYHLLGLVGNASYWDNGAPRLEPMDFVKETAHFYFYRPHAADSPTIEFAFAKYAEIPASDGLLQSAAWRRDRSGWHWEWTHRDSPATEMPAPPTLLIPGPVSKSQSAANVPAVVVATQR